MGCHSCTKTLPADAVLPTLYMTVMVEETTPFLWHFLERIEKLSYPREKLDVLVHNQVTIIQEPIDQY